MRKKRIILTEPHQKVRAFLSFFFVICGICIIAFTITLYTNILHNNLAIGVVNTFLVVGVIFFFMGILTVVGREKAIFYPDQAEVLIKEHNKRKAIPFSELSDFSLEYHKQKLTANPYERKGAQFLFTLQNYELGPIYESSKYIKTKRVAELIVRITNKKLRTLSGRKINSEELATPYHKKMAYLHEKTLEKPPAESQMYIEQAKDGYTIFSTYKEGTFVFAHFLFAFIFLLITIVMGSLFFLDTIAAKVIGAIFFLIFGFLVVKFLTEAILESFPKKVSITKERFAVFGGRIRIPEIREINTEGDVCLRVVGESKEVHVPSYFCEKKYKNWLERNISIMIVRLAQQEY